MAITILLTLFLGVRVASAQTTDSNTSEALGVSSGSWEPPVMDIKVFAHVLFDHQFEGRTNGPDNELRWDAQGWIGTGLADLDAGVRLRYEIRRKLAPYIGFAYSGKFGETAAFSRQAGTAVAEPPFAFGIRLWY